MIERFIFLHIMKTAGTTLRDEFYRIYGENNVLLDNSYSLDKVKSVGIFNLGDESSTYYNSNYKEYKVIQGHFKYEKYSHLNWPYITFLRSPIKRVVSHFSNMKNVDFYEFCRRSSNVMTVATGGDLNKFLFIGLVEQYVESLRRLEKILGCYFDKRKRLNITKKKVILNKNQIEYIKKYNQKDLKLYEQALRIFSQG